MNQTRIICKEGEKCVARIFGKHWAHMTGIVSHWKTLKSVMDLNKKLALCLSGYGLKHASTYIESSPIWIMPLGNIQFPENIEHNNVSCKQKTQLLQF